MIKSFLPLLYTSGGVVAAGVAGYTVVASQPDEVPIVAEQTEIVAPAELVEKPKAGKIKISKLLAEKTEIPAAPKLKPPVFSVLRVEPDGSSVIAGTGPAASTVKLLDDGKEIAITLAGPEGDFAFVLDKPLAPGAHELGLLATTKSGETIASEESGLVNVPLPEKAEELAVLVTKQGEASRILVKPEAPKAEPVAATPKETEEAVAAVTVKADTENLSVAVTEVDPLKPKPAEKPAVTGSPRVPVLLEAAEIEGDSLFIAGTGEAGSEINIYLGEEYLGRAIVAGNGAFLFEGKKAIKPGRHKIRADMVRKKSSDVLARAEVDLVHEPEPVRVAAVSPQTQEKVETTSITEPVAEPQTVTVSESAQVEEAQPVSRSEEVEENTVTATEQASVQLASSAEPPVQELRTGAAVIIRRGDSLWRVARRNYGAGIRYTTIFEANRDQVRDPDLIYPGQVLKVPEDETSPAVTDNG
ncbi:MAG: LysM peptidoglycan-binding domain-containing protein [Pseudomonadota bacterium]